MSKFNVAYDSPHGVQHYQLMGSSRDVAEASLAQFKSRYVNEDGTPKAYPNGKGHYKFTNPRVVQTGV